MAVTINCHNHCKLQVLFTILSVNQHCHQLLWCLLTTCALTMVVILSPSSRLAITIRKLASRGTSWASAWATSWDSGRARSSWQICCTFWTLNTQSFDRKFVTVERFWPQKAKVVHQCFASTSCRLTETSTRGNRPKKSKILIKARFTVTLNNGTCTGPGQNRIQVICVSPEFQFL